MKLGELLKLIREGEGQRLEFKRDVPRDVAAEICAFANTDGGEILFGIDDQGNMVGVDARVAKEKISAALNSIFPAPKVNFEEFEVEGRHFLALKIEKVQGLCAIGGTAHIRIGTMKRPMSLNELITSAAENLLMTTLDRQRTTAGEAEIEEDFLKWFNEKRRRRGMDHHEIREYLKKIGVLVRTNGQWSLSLAGLLFFSKDPQIYLPHSYLRLNLFGEWKRLGGPIWAIVDELERILNRELKTISLKSGFRREDYLEYPMEAVREAVVNALVHRNYAVESEVFVYLEAGRLRVVNPGGFPPGVSPEEPRPVPRNPLLYELMFQAGYVERQGNGIRLIMEKCGKHPFCRVLFKTGGGFTEVVFEKKMDALVGELGSRILELLSDDWKNSSEIAGELGMSKITILRKLNLLVSEGLVEKTGKGPAVKYRRRYWHSASA